MPRGGKRKGAGAPSRKMPRGGKRKGAGGSFGNSNSAGNKGGASVGNTNFAGNKGGPPLGNTNSAGNKGGPPLGNTNSAGNKGGASVGNTNSSSREKKISKLFEEGCAFDRHSDDVNALFKFRKVIELEPLHANSNYCIGRLLAHKFIQGDVPTRGA